MRIGFGQYSAPEVSSAKETEAAVSSRKFQATNEDSFSGDQVSIALANSTLSADALNEPDVRQQRVDALRTAVEKGDYAVGSDQIADAICRELSIVA